MPSAISKTLTILKLLCGAGLLYCSFNSKHAARGLRIRKLQTIQRYTTILNHPRGWGGKPKGLTQTAGLPKYHIFGNPVFLSKGPVRFQVLEVSCWYWIAPSAVLKLPKRRCWISTGRPRS